MLQQVGTRLGGAGLDGAGGGVGWMLQQVKVDWEYYSYISVWGATGAQLNVSVRSYCSIYTITE